jgi:type II secretory pathway pseudopilin PulG
MVIGIVIAALGLVGFFMLVLKPKRNEASKLTQQVSSAQQRLDTARTNLAAGTAARSSYAANYATVARLGKAVPTDDDIPSLVYQLDSTAGSTGVDFRSVKLTSGAGSGPPASQTAANAAAATSDQGSAKDGQKKDGEAQTGTPAAPAAATQTATAALPPGAVVGPAGLSTMPFTFAFEGDFFRLSDFLTRLERYIKPTRRSIKVRGRLLLVDGISLSAAGSGFPKMKASIAATAYLLPPQQGLFNGATPQGPTAAGTAQPVSSGSTSGPPTAPATVTP